MYLSFLNTFHLDCKIPKYLSISFLFSSCRFDCLPYSTVCGVWIGFSNIYHEIYIPQQRKQPIHNSTPCSCILYDSGSSILYTPHTMSRNSAKFSTIFLSLFVLHHPENQCHTYWSRSNHTSTRIVASFPSLLLWYWPFNSLR